MAQNQAIKNELVYLLRWLMENSSLCVMTLESIEKGTTEGGQSFHDYVRGRLFLSKEMEDAIAHLVEHDRVPDDMKSEEELRQDAK